MCRLGFCCHHCPKSPSTSQAPFGVSVGISPKCSAPFNLIFICNLDSVYSKAYEALHGQNGAE
ncbi:hypothetical protein DF142_24340 [Burkholderia cenocepacia]|nr:hypothetical protein DF142_24340 [Burkholderia cenocepacia]RQU67097.1 hypothetical protein DF140_15000 [Burkholderia cenocepacia]RQU88865.1 hypothetical protein DF040_21135 [Burkholderia cenocepacia]